MSNSRVRLERRLQVGEQLWISAASHVSGMGPRCIMAVRRLLLHLDGPRVVEHVEAIHQDRLSTRDWCDTSASISRRRRRTCTAGEDRTADRNALDIDPDGLAVDGDREVQSFDDFL
jgi:hypothetical protein